MRGHNICFDGVIRKIIPKLSLISPLIWNTADIICNTVKFLSIGTERSGAGCSKHR